MLAQRSRRLNQRKINLISQKRKPVEGSMTAGEREKKC